jgi:hypothetical protein
MIGEGCIGSDVTSMFVMFINNRLDKLVSPEVIAHSDWNVVKSEVIPIVGNGPTYRADLASVLAHRYINYMIEYAKKNPISEKQIDRLEQIVKEFLFGVDLNFLIVKELFHTGSKFKGIGLRSQLAKLVIS